MLRQLRVVHDARLASGLDNGLGLVHAVEVGGTAQVLATVLGVYPTEVHGDVSEVIDRRETVFYERSFPLIYYSQEGLILVYEC